MSDQQEPTEEQWERFATDHILGGFGSIPSEPPKTPPEDGMKFRVRYSNGSYIPERRVFGLWCAFLYNHDHLEPYKRRFSSESEAWAACRAYARRTKSRDTVSETRDYRKEYGE